MEKNNLVHAREIIKLINEKFYTVEELEKKLQNKFGKTCKYQDMFGVEHDFEGVLKVMQEREKISIDDNVVRFLGCSGNCSSSN